MTDTHRQDQQKNRLFSVQYRDNRQGSKRLITTTDVQETETLRLTNRKLEWFFCIISYTSHSECGEYEQAVFSLEGELHLWKGFPQTALYEK